MPDPLSRLKEDILKGYDDRTLEDLDQALQDGLRPLEIVNNCLVPAIFEVGLLWNEGKLYLPDVILSVEAFKMASAPMRESLRNHKDQTIGCVVLGTVHGDAHDLGKDIVAALLVAAGFEVKDLGINVATEDFLSAIKEHQPDILALGAYMSTTVPAMKEVVDAVRGTTLSPGMRVMVGGRAVSKSEAQQMGAEGYGQDALEAVDCARKLVGLEENITDFLSRLSKPSLENLRSKGALTQDTCNSASD